MVIETCLQVAGNLWKMAANTSRTELIWSLELQSGLKDQSLSEKANNPGKICVKKRNVEINLIRIVIVIIIPECSVSVS